MTSLPARYRDDLTVTPLKTGGRADWYVGGQKDNLPVAFADTDIVAQLRRFFDQLEAEAERQRDDPIALVNALARLEALLADVRMVTQSVRTYAAEALADNKVRRFTIEDLVTVEGTSEATRSGWQDKELLAAMLMRALVPVSGVLMDRDTGTLWTVDDMAKVILEWFRVQWRLTPIRDWGLDPDDYSTLPTDEDGKPIRTPTVRMVHNTLRDVD